MPLGMVMQYGRLSGSMFALSLEVPFAGGLVACGQSCRGLGYMLAGHGQWCFVLHTDPRECFAAFTTKH